MSSTVEIITLDQKQDIGLDSNELPLLPIKGSAGVIISKFSSGALRDETREYCTWNLLLQYNRRFSILSRLEDSLRFPVR